MLNHLPFTDQPTIEINHDFVYICVYQERSLILLEWKHQITFIERKKGFLMALNLVNQYQINNLIVSDQHLLFISVEEKNWLLTDWVEQISQTPLLKLAVVAPDDYNYAVDNYSFTTDGQKKYQAKGEVELRIYKNYKGAFNWVLSTQDKEAW